MSTIKDWGGFLLAETKCALDHDQHWHVQDRKLKHGQINGLRRLSSKVSRISGINDESILGDTNVDILVRYLAQYSSS